MFDLVNELFYSLSAPFKMHSVNPWASRSVHFWQSNSANSQFNVHMVHLHLASIIPKVLGLNLASLQLALRYSRALGTQTLEVNLKKLMLGFHLGNPKQNRDKTRSPNPNRSNRKNRNRINRKRRFRRYGSTCWTSRSGRTESNRRRPGQRKTKPTWNPKQKIRSRKFPFLWTSNRIRSRNRKSKSPMSHRKWKPRMSSLQKSTRTNILNRRQLSSKVTILPRKGTFKLFNLRRFKLLIVDSWDNQVVGLWIQRVW